MKRNGPVCLIAAVLWLVLPPPAEGQPQPSYSAESIVNAASSTPVIASDTYASIFGLNLSSATSAVSGEDLASGWYPRMIAGVRVLLDGTPAVLTYVSPGQINFLVPSGLQARGVPLRVVSGDIAGPLVMLPLHDVAPALFLFWGTQTAVASHADFSVITADRPAHGDELIILWATGLGKTTPSVPYGEVPRQAARLVRSSEFRVFLDGWELPPERLWYAGIAPGFAGLYQINIHLPAGLSADPEVRIGVGDQMSPAGVRIPFRDASASVAQPAAAAIR